MEILRTERLTHEKWLNLFRRDFQHNGKPGQWIFASRRSDPPLPSQGCDAVVIVPILLEDGKPPRLVVTREYRVPLGDYEYSFPAGLLEEGETLQSTAQRELLEETGFEVVAVTKVSPPTYSSAGMSDEAVAFVFVTARARLGGRPDLQDSEDIEVVLLDYRQVCELCDSQKKINGRAWPVLYMFQQLGKLA